MAAQHPLDSPRRARDNRGMTTAAPALSAAAHPTAEVADPPETDISVDDFLALMAAEQAEEDADSGPRGGLYLATGGVRPRPKLRYSHKAMADMVLMCPGISQNKIAATFGRTPGWVSTIMTSDAFLSYLEKRRAEVVDPEITLSLRERAVALTTRSMQVLQDKLARPADQVSEALALRAFELGAKAVGLGGNATPPPPVDPATYLPQLADRLIRLRSGAAAATDATVVNG